ncbi:MAG: SOS response-associated peptidase [Pseudomonadales bacterium]
MCGRYNIIDDPFVQALLKTLGVDMGSLPTRFNIAPTEQVPVVHELDGDRRLSDMRWWLVPSWSSGPNQKYAMFNARAESILSSRAYGKPFERQRAIIPASSFIEWQKTADGKQPLMIESGAGVWAFAGIWDCWQGGDEPLYSCSIITKAATSEFSALHNRMPICLSEGDYAQWLDNKTPLSEVLPLLAKDSTALLKVTELNTAVNNARNKGIPIPVGDAIYINKTH